MRNKVAYHPEDSPMDCCNGAPNATDTANQIATDLHLQAERLADFADRLLGRCSDPKPTLPGGVVPTPIPLVPALHMCLSPLERIEKTIHELSDRIG